MDAKYKNNLGSTVKITAQELTTLYSHLNTVFFNNELHPVTIEVVASKKFLGCVELSGNMFTGRTLRSLQISGSFVFESYESLLSTFLHEMIHVKQHQFRPNELEFNPHGIGFNNEGKIIEEIARKKGIKNIEITIKGRRSEVSIKSKNVVFIVCEELDAFICTTEKVYNTDKTGFKKLILPCYSSFVGKEFKVFTAQTESAEITVRRKIIGRNVTFYRNKANKYYNKIEKELETFTVKG